jgi:hypothetical protein
VEVLDENRYSTASDVWAFGIAVWEIVTDGATPYGDTDNLVLVAERIKGGAILPRPHECPTSVYADLMVPCWDPNPKARPTFAELEVVAQSCGGVMADVRFPHEGSSTGSEVSRSLPRDNLADPDLYPAAFWAGPDGHRLRGVSVHHIAHDLPAAAVKATRVPFPHHGRTIDPPPVDGITVLHTVAAVVVPWCEMRVCPRDGGKGCAYVDSLSGPDNVGPSSAMLSYSWSYRIVDVAEALAEWATAKGRNPARTYIWMCALCLNQLRINRSSVLIVGPDELAAEFGPRITSIGRILPLLAPWDTPT